MIGLLRNRRHLGTAVVAAVVLLGLVGCSGGEGGKGGSSRTPRITVASEAPEDQDALLTEQDLHGITGFEGVVAAEVKDVPFHENPDPRGPCGATVPAIAFEGAFGRTFRSDRVQLLQLVLPSSPRQKHQLAAYQADVRPDCPPYESGTNTGDTQRVSDITVLALDDLGVPAVGWASTIELGGQRVQAGVVLADVGDRFVFLQFHARTLPTPSDLHELARRSVDRLRSRR